jgi:FkbM family methyltransferase
MFKGIARQLAPRWLWSHLRTWKMQRSVARFAAYTTEHSYGGLRLRVHIGDPLARGWYDHDWPALPEIDLLRQHRLHPGARVFDIGAHQGVVALMLAHAVGPAGEVVAVEALPHNVRICETNRALNGVQNLRPLHAAISDRPGTVALALDLNAQVRHARSMSRSIQVPAVTIDELSERYGVPDVLFIDVEGFECHALRGARQTLQRRPDCFVEVHAGCGLELAGGTIEELFTHLPAPPNRSFVWTEDSRHPVSAAGPADCPAGRFFLAALADRNGV